LQDDVGKLSNDPDRSRQYRDASPEKLRDQLNENWKQLRVFAAAVADRDRVIDSMHKSLAERDKTIKLQNERSVAQERVNKIKVALLYSLVGGAAAKGAEAGIMALVHVIPRLLHIS
jgi:gamma-glutamyl phosphate reductase